MILGLPHPGPRPEAFAFPFAEASAALAAIDDVIAELAGVLAVHEEAVVAVRVGFEGETRRHFDEGFAQLMGEVDLGVRDLQLQRDQLEDDVAEARRLRDASLDAIHDWERDMAAYQAADRRVPS